MAAVRPAPQFLAADLPEVAFGPSEPKAEAQPAINPTGRELRFIVPVADGEVYLGDLELAVSPRDELSVDGARLLDLLKDRLEAALLARLASSFDPKGRLAAPTLGAAGIVLHYDAERLALRLDLPIGGRVRQALSFRNYSADLSENTVEPAKVSAFVNVFGSVGHNQTRGSAGLVAPTAQVEAAVRVRGLVLETEAYLSALAGDRFLRRTGTRLIYDDQRHAVRWTAGDTQYNPRQFQGSASVLGLGVSRLYSVIDPQREVRSSGAQSFTMVNPGTIETIVNGRPVERRIVQPGQYTLRDFPLSQGANSVQLKVEESGGRVRTIDFSVYSNQSLLATGITEFAAFAGVYSEPNASGYAYSKDWMIGGFVRRGLTEQMTLGVNVQANKSVQQVSMEGVLGSPVGLIGFNLTGSRNQNGQSGMAAAMTFERQLLSNDGHSDSIRAAVEWRSARFVIPEVAFGPDRKVWSLTAGYVRTFASGNFVSVDGQYSRDRLPKESNYNLRVAAGLRLGPRLELTPEVGLSRSATRRESFARIGLRMRFGQSGTAQVDADSLGRVRASFATSNGSGIASRQFSGEIARNNGMVALTANANLLTNRADISIQQSSGWSEATRKVSDSRTTLRTAFSLAWAEGTLAMGRPISDAFLIAKAHRTLKGKQIKLDPANDGEAARTDRLGPALLGQLGSYSRRNLIYSVPDAPSGYDLGAGNVQIRPPYRAGYRIEIGSDYNLLVVGRLLDNNDQPVSLIAGKAIDLDNPKHPAITIFTSRDGRFGAQGLRPGRWRIEMPGKDALIYDLTVIAGDDGTARVGNIKPKPSGLNQRNEK